MPTMCVPCRSYTCPQDKRCLAGFAVGSEHRPPPNLVYLCKQDWGTLLRQSNIVR